MLHGGGLRRRWRMPFRQVVGVRHLYLYHVSQGIAKLLVSNREYQRFGHSLLFVAHNKRSYYASLESNVRAYQHQLGFNTACLLYYSI